MWSFSRNWMTVVVCQENSQSWKYNFFGLAHKTGLHCAFIQLHSCFFFKKVSFALIVQEYKGELEKQLGLSWPLVTDLHSDEKLVMVYEEEQVLHCLENWLGPLYVELLACISVMSGCFVLSAFALPILVSYLSLLIWKFEALIMQLGRLRQGVAKTTHEVTERLEVSSRILGMTSGWNWWFGMSQFENFNGDWCVCVFSPTPGFSSVCSFPSKRWKAL